LFFFLQNINRFFISPGVWRAWSDSELSHAAESQTVTM